MSQTPKAPLNIFLDDVRAPKDCVSYMASRVTLENLKLYSESNWLVVRTYEQFRAIIIAAFRAGREVSCISFDHDLADEHYESPESEEKKYEEKTGYDAAKWVKEFYETANYPLPKILVHSMNPVGTQNIINVFKT